MTPEQEFKVAFLQTCARAGLTPAETHELVKKALAEEKSAFLDRLVDKTVDTVFSTGQKGLDALGRLGTTGLALAGGTALAVPPIAGYAIGDMAGRAQDVDDVDVEEMRKQHMIAEYKRLARSLKNRKREMI